MHAVVMDSLEEYLAGSLEPADERAIETHLIACDTCREQVRGMQNVSQLFGSLRSEELFESSPAFLANVMREVGGRWAVRSFPGFLGLDLAFGRRLVFASLVTLAVLGGYLVSHESNGLISGVSPEALLAQQDSPTFSSGPAQDNMLATLTAYDRR